MKTAGSSSASKTPHLEAVRGLNDSLLPLLKGVSRSFYLSIRILPARLRPTFALAYLLARAADTFCDAPGLSREVRRRHLETFRRLIQTPQDDTAGSLAAARSDLAEHIHAEERFLVDSLPTLLDLYVQLPLRQKAITEKVLLTLTQGMLEDLNLFTGRMDSPRCLKTPFDTERYAYLVAGCVGEFWTDLLIAENYLSWERQRMVKQAIRFGQGLQMINILRDFPRDIEQGRCYLSAAELSAHGLELSEISALRQRVLDEHQSRAVAAKLQKLYHSQIELARQWLREGMGYVKTIPRRSLRLRLAVLWPLFIGLATLDQLATTPLEAHFQRPVKISRHDVYRLLLATLLFSGSNRLLDSLYRRKGGSE